MAKILIIENSEDVLDMVSMVLNTYGHEVAGTSGKDNLTSKISSFNPQLVLLDVRQGRPSGREICQQIKTANEILPVILMSTDANFLVDYESCLANDILEKPFEIKELKNKIDNLLSDKIISHNRSSAGLLN